MEVLRISGGHRFRLRHGPSDDVRELKKPLQVAFSPRGLKFLKPKILVKEGDTVSLGQEIVTHKRDSRIKFCSPASGVVHEIRYGPRRVLEAIIISVDHDAEKNLEAIGAHTQSEINALDKSEVENKMLAHGLWAYLECFPGWGIAPLSSTADGIADDREIAAVHINLVRTEAHWPNPLIAIEGKNKELSAGIAALAKLGNKIRIYVLQGSKVDKAIADLGELIEVANKYPAENIGVQAFYAGDTAKKKVVIGANAELVMDIGHLLLHGKKRTDRTFCIAGNAATSASHYRGRAGIAIGDLVDGSLKISEDVRLIAGGLFCGEKVRFQDFLGEQDTSLQAYVEDKKRIPFVFFRLGLDRLTLSKTWLGGFNTDVEREATTSNNGEERACIQCGYCIDICPVELMPNLIMKASTTDDIERMEWLSISDCVDCGLCTFVCPSKIELGQAIESGKRLIEKEG